VLSRQQLLKYRASTGFSANALQYSRTFSRDLNAPTWSPSTPVGSTIDYAGQMNAASSANRDVLGVRVTTSFTRADGTTAQSVNPREISFSAQPVAGISYQGIDTTDNTTLGTGALAGVFTHATAATIQRDFGLVWVAGDGTTDPTNPRIPLIPTRIYRAPFIGITAGRAARRFNPPLPPLVRLEAGAEFL